MRTSTRRVAGFTLVELMIGLALGLIVTSSAIGIFVSNGNTYRATESLGRIQENARVAFELMARDIREAGGNVCSRNLPMANVLRNAGSAWWASAPGIRGYDGSQAFSELPFGTGAGQRVAGTQGIEIVSAAASPGLSVVNNPAMAAALHVNSRDHGFVPGDILMVCDSRQMSIFQMTNPGPMGVGVRNWTIVRNTGGRVHPGNCTQRLGLRPEPAACNQDSGSPYSYEPGSQIAKVRAVRWYVGNNGRGGRSLYQTALRNAGAGGDGAAIRVEEVAEGITDLQFQFLPIDGAAYAAPAAITDWSQIAAVRVTVTLRGGQGSIIENVGTDGAALQRQFAHVVTLRNRLP